MGADILDHDLLHWMDRRYLAMEPLIMRVNQLLWTYAEPSGEEYRSSALLIQTLREHGFSIKEHVCGRPTAFIVSYGSGNPVIGFLGEYDALPSLSQVAGVSGPTEIPGSGYGHGCGHCALGSGSLAAALLVRYFLEEHHLDGTIRYYGCCDEEVDGVKPLMVKAGMFDDVDCVFAWHPGGETGVPNSALAAMQSFHVVFHTQSPDMQGADRTLQACELMNIGVNYLREHVPSDVRMHYAYLEEERTLTYSRREQSALAYTVRTSSARKVREVVRRVELCAQGAAMMTGTTCEILEKNGYADRFQNYVVANILSDAARDVGAPHWDEKDYSLALISLR